MKLLAVSAQRSAKTVGHAVRRVGVRMLTAEGFSLSDQVFGRWCEVLKA
jgi:hypothetical protein